MFYFNNALNRFNLKMYGIGYIIKDHPDNEGKPTTATSVAILSN